MRQPFRRTLVALALCLAARAHAGPLVTRIAAPTQPAVAAKNLPVLDLGTVPPKPYRVLAVITLENPGPKSLDAQPDHEYWARLLRAPARAAGAQAVVGVHAVQKVLEPTWVVSALAVEYPEAGAAPDSCGCVVSVPEPRVHLGVKEKDRAAIARSLHLRLAVLCAERGWYPLADDYASPAALGHGVDARLSLALDSLRAPVDPMPEGHHGVTPDLRTGVSDQVACVATLVGAAGDTLYAGSRAASTTNLEAILHRQSNDPRGPTLIASEPPSATTMQWMLHAGPRGPIDADYWRAVQRELETLPGPARAR